MLATLLNTIFPVFILIFFGWLYAKIRPQVSTRSINDICLYLGIPAIILKDMVGLKAGDVQVEIILTASFMASFLPGIIGLVWLKLTKNPHQGLLLPIIFMNGINLPLPIVRLHWGEAGVAVAVVFFTLLSGVMYILGILLAAKKDRVKEVLKLPLVWALVIVLVVNKYNLVYPKAIENLISISAGMAYPLMLILMGIILGRVKIHELDGGIKLPLTAALIRILGGVIGVVSVVYILGATGINREVILFYGIMPGAIATTLFAEKFGRDSEQVAMTVFISTLISLCLIPVVLVIL